jgi:hypothetical protein
MIIFFALKGILNAAFHRALRGFCGRPSLYQILFIKLFQCLLVNRGGWPTSARCKTRHGQKTETRIADANKIKSHISIKKWQGTEIESFLLVSYNVCKYFDIQFSPSIEQFNCQSVISKYNTLFGIVGRFIVFIRCFIGAHRAFVGIMET